MGEVERTRGPRGAASYTKDDGWLADPGRSGIPVDQCADELIAGERCTRAARVGGWQGGARIVWGREWPAEWGSNGKEPMRGFDGRGFDGSGLDGSGLDGRVGSWTIERRTRGGREAEEAERPSLAKGAAHNTRTLSRCI